MKIRIPLEELIGSLEKSSLAALTKESQDEEVRKIRPTDSCIKITASKDAVTFESSSKEVAALRSTKDKDIIVKKEGACCVEAKSYMKMLKTIPKDCSVQISYKPNKNYAKDAFGGIIQPNGILTTIAFKNKKEIRRGTNDTFPVEEFAPVDYAHKKVLFSIQAKTLQEAVSQVLFATDPSDLSEMLDSIAIVVSGNKIHFAGTDGKRCAIYSVVANEKDAAILLDDQKTLIDGILLKTSCKSFDDYDVIEVIDCEDAEHVILSADNTKIRLRVASDEVKQQFPNFINILSVICPTSIVLNKSQLLEAVEFLSQYNPEKSIYHVCKGKSEIKIEAARRGANPESATVECEPIAASLINPAAMSNQFIIDGCKKTGGKDKGCKVQISFSKDERKIRMQATDDTSFVYLQQSMTLE